MTLQDLEHRVENVEAQHASYITVLSNHMATLANFGTQISDLQRNMTHVIAELAVVRQDVAALRQGQERLESFLRSKLGNGHDET
jgi:uncharacterized coiled-coil protein SlyX